jgi:hypothetical protein
MQSFFDPVVEQVLALIQRRLDKARESNLDCRKMLLVGGFAGKRARVYFQIGASLYDPRF